jgi:hypothetical protein
MFPEMPIAAILVLVAPFWAISLLVNHHPVAAVLLVVGVGVCGYLTFLAARANEKWGAHLSIVAILVVAALVASHT